MNTPDHDPGVNVPAADPDAPKRQEDGDKTWSPDSGEQASPNRPKDGPDRSAEPDRAQHAADQSADEPGDEDIDKTDKDDDQDTETEPSRAS